MVPRNLTGLAVRRLLASGDLGPPPGGGRPGVVNVTFTTTSQGGMVPFMSYQLTNCGISSAHTTAGQTGLPTESYSLSFGQIQFTFQNMDQSGKSSPTITGYNLETAQQM